LRYDLDTSCKKMNLILIRQLKLLAFTVDILMQILVIFKKIYLLLLLQNIARNPADSIELSDVNLRLLG